VENDKNQGTYIDPGAGKITFKTYAAEWLAAQQHTPTTAETYERHLRNHMNPVFGARPLASVRPTQVQGWVTSLTRDRGLAASTACTVYRVFAGIFNSAVIDGRLKRSPCVSIRLPRIQETTVRFLEAEQVQDLAEAMPARYRALVLTAAGAGLRQGECFGVCLDSVDFLGRVLHVRRQIRMEAGRPVLVDQLKTPASRRSVPMPDFLIEALSVHFAQFGGEESRTPIFTAARGGLVRRGVFNDHVWKPAVKKAELEPDTTFHDLRHTYASLLIAQSVPIKEVSQWMGHKSITETADTYGHLYPAAESRARAALDEAFSAAAESKLA
jgi:integrase